MARIGSARLQNVNTWASLLIPLTLACGSPEGMNPDDPNNPNDTTAPTFAGAATAAPGNPTTAPGSIDISWKAASDDKSAAEKLTYLIYQASATNGESFTSPSYTTQAGATSYNVSGLKDAMKYFFVVRARDEAGNIDSNRAEVSATTPDRSDKQAPTFPGLNTATPNGTKIMLAWNEATDNVTKPAKMVYLIYQAETAGGQKFAQPATHTTAAGASSFEVTGLMPGKDYFFVVRARDEAGNFDMNTTEKSAKTGASMVSFKTDVQPILDGACTGCHGAMSPAAMLDLSSAAASYAALVSKASVQCPTDPRVVPSSPDKSYLMWKIKGAAPMGGCYKGVQMPKGGSPLSSAQMATVNDWIAAGAPNN